MYNRITIILAAVLILSGCAKESNLFSRRNGDRVVFCLPYGNQSTKTSYSGTQADGTIYWISTDAIRIWSDAATTSKGGHYADYGVLPKGGDEDIAKIQPYDGGNGLVWGNGDHAFYALYPSPETSVDPEVVAIDETTVTMTFPSTQNFVSSSVSGTTRTLMPDMRSAYMVAATTAENSGGTGSAVELDFKAQYTAFEFIVKNGPEGNLNLTSLQLISDRTDLVATTVTASIVGTDATVALDNYSVSNLPSENKRLVEVPLGTALAPMVVPANNTLVVTVLTMAKEDISGLTVRFNTPSGYRALALKYASSYLAANPSTPNSDGYVIFPRGKKVSLKGFEIPGVLYVSFHDITIGGHLTQDLTTGNDDSDDIDLDWKLIPYEIVWNVIGIYGQVIEDMYNLVRWDNPWGVLVVYPVGYGNTDITGHLVWDQDVIPSFNTGWGPLPIVEYPIYNVGSTIQGQETEDTDVIQTWNVS